MTTFPADVVADMADRATRLRADWLVGSPVHTATMRALRTLRNMAPRSYEVCYRHVVLAEPVAETTAWLNERAERNAKPERYTDRDVLAILIAGTSFAVEMRTVF